MQSDQYMSYIHISRYAKYRDDLGRRETWEETVARYFDYMTEHLAENNNYQLPPELRKELEDAVVNLEVMPSMRALMTSGAALRRDNICAFNCSYLPIDHPRAFDELLYILMCGTGVGFSVERQYVNELPTINEHFEKSSTVIVVDDSKAGWAKGLRELISLLYAGQIPSWDLSKLRPAGARLKTFGGRSSGPGPLEDVFKFTVALFRQAAGRKLTSLEAHDLVCKIAECVVVGGVRRSALISLSNLSDDRMRLAKSGQWWEANVQRSLANNSVAYTEKPDVGIFMEEWLSLYKSKSGERGIFNRVAATKQAAKNGRRNVDFDFGTNPCGEIILRPYGFCNLSEIVARAEDDFTSLARKARLAAILGTYQASLTNFKYLRKIWTKNAQEDALLGVSITGVMDNPILSGEHDTIHTPLAKFLEDLKQVVIDTNKEFAEKFGINQSAATTCNKPSGTVSQRVNSSSGMHKRFGPYYIRTVRGSNNDPLVQFMKDKGFPWEPDVTKPDLTSVFSFPVKSPESVTSFRNDWTAVQQLEHALIFKNHWCEHNPSITVYVKETEWPEVGAWVYKHFDDLVGVSFLPHTEHVYRQAPYQDITKEEYEEALSKMPVVDWTELQKYEKEDNTSGSQELACSAGSCEIVDIS